jgi:hypothetical protein
MLNRQIAYCTNVHAGPDWATAVDNLRQYTVPIRESLVQCGAWQATEPMGVGLWLAEPAAKFAVASRATAELKDWMASQRLLPFTMNGFPQGNFHQTVVKHRVYQPEWWKDERREYTDLLITILDQLLPQNVPGSISTLPIAWGFPKPTEDQLLRAAQNLGKIADRLDNLYQETGRCIVLAIEPEPGCYLTDNNTMRQFFRDYLFRDDSQSEKRRKYLTVCHDVCHAAVMREDQSVEFAKHRAEGIRLGKVQVSSAIAINWDSISKENKPAVFEQLKSFAEDRYLHQTTVHDNERPVTLHEDLPGLLSSIADPRTLDGSWRIHFHVPIFLDSSASDSKTSLRSDATRSLTPDNFLGIGTTQQDILQCIRLLEASTGIGKVEPEAADGTESHRVDHNHENDFLTGFFTGHYEVETYAWTVLPQIMRPKNSLVQDIQRELTFFKSLFSEGLSSWNVSQS